MNGKQTDTAEKSGRLTDEELVERFHGGDKAAGEQLLTRYKNTVLMAARRFFLSGGETEDLVQEGMCGLYAAMMSYDRTQAGFSAYAGACIRNRIVDAVKAGNNSKNAALNHFVSIPEVGETLFSREKNPEDALISSETQSELACVMREHLSALEYRVTSMYIDGLTMAEISSSLGRSVKCIDNAIARAKRKLQKLWITEG